MESNPSPQSRAEGMARELEEGGTQGHTLLQDPGLGEGNQSIREVRVYRTTRGAYSVDMNIGGVKVKAKIYSGAEVSLLSSKCFDKLPLQE